MPSNPIKALPVLAVALVLSLGFMTTGWSQVTTANVTGTVTDQTGAFIPGAEVTLINEGNAQERTVISSDTGEFRFDFITVGSYTLRIEMPGFSTSVNTGQRYSAGQTVRQTFELAVGQVSEEVTVEGGTPQISTASTEQRETLDSIQVQELPVARRNLTNILRLSVGLSVDTGFSTRGVRFAGIGKHGSGISVDGTDANANPEGRGLGTYQGRNYIDVMSIDAIEEIQIMRGILPADIGEVLGGQINVISKSGTNQFHGNLFENYESHGFNAWSNPFATGRDTTTGDELDHPRTVFNQFGGSIGGPIVQDKGFFFFTYEGYRERRSKFVDADVPTAEVRNAVKAALPFVETDLNLGMMALPTLAGDTPGVGIYEVAKGQTALENHYVVKGDWLVTPSSQLTVGYTRNNPSFVNPRADIGNDRTWSNSQDRLTFQFVTGSSDWTSESRFGYNRVTQFRLDGVFTVMDPDNAEATYGGRRLPYMRLDGNNPSTSTLYPGYDNWSVPDGEIYEQAGDQWSLDQKVSTTRGQHAFKIGARYDYRGGFRTNPETPRIRFRNLDDLLINKIDSARPTFGNTKFDSKIFSVALFLHDDWRATQKLTLNMGIRYNYYSNAQVMDDPAFVDNSCICNAASPTDWPTFNFGSVLSEQTPVGNDAGVNLGPRFGFAYNPDGEGQTVVRGGAAVMFSPQMPAVLLQGVGDTIIPFRVNLVGAEARELGLAWPNVWNDDLRPIVKGVTDASGKRFVSSFFDPDLQNPYAMHWQLNIQRQLARDLMMEVGYVGSRGVKFIMHRRFNQPDRLTGIRPNALLNPSLYYVDNSQQTVYNAFQLSVRKRFSSSYSFDMHYTWGKGMASQGGAGDIGAYYQGDNGSRIQDFFDIALARGPGNGDITHNFVSDFIYEIPTPDTDSAFMRHLVGGWQFSGILGARTGHPLFIDRSCSGSYHCRPDHNGSDPIFSNWKSNENTANCYAQASCPVDYINGAQFTDVGRHSPDVSGVETRPGTTGLGLLRGPGAWTLDFSMAKNFSILESTTLQWRFDMFNALNHVNFASPRTRLSSSRFGQIRGTSGPMRTAQMSLRLRF